MENKDNARDNGKAKVSAAQAGTSAKKQKGATELYGKFSSPEALYASYIELEAEFTRKSQLLKRIKKVCEEHGIELDDDCKENGATETSDEQTPPEAKGERLENADEQTKEENDEGQVEEHPKGERQDKQGETSDKVTLTKEEKEEIIREYLREISQNNIPLLRGDGVNVAAEKQKPKTVAAAGGLALRYFKKR